MKVNYDEAMRYLKFRAEVNKVSLKDIEWGRDDGTKIDIHPEIIKDWELIGMGNITFAEMHLTRVVKEGPEALLKEIEETEQVAIVLEEI